MKESYSLTKAVAIALSVVLLDGISAVAVSTEDLVDTLESTTKAIEVAQKQAHQERKTQELQVKRSRRLQQLSTRGLQKSVPSNDTSFKSYMSYRAITNRSSPQYKLNNSSQCYSDSQGMRRHKVGTESNEELDDYVIAVGSFYGKVGDRLRIELSSGLTFTAVIGDIKADAHTDSTNRQHLSDNSVVEFLVDNSRFNGLARRMGDVSYLEYKHLNKSFHGRVQSIEVLK